MIHRLPPSVRHEAAYVRVQLLQGRGAQARGDARATEAFARAGEAAVDVELDEADYPPAVRKAYKAARAGLRARPRRAVELASEPAGARSRSTASSQAEPRRSCRCPRGAASCRSRAPASSRISPPARTDRDHRDPRAGGKRWAARPATRAHRDGSRLVPRAPAARHAGRRGGARWIVVLDSRQGARAQGAGVLAADHALKPVEPSRLLETELDKLSAAVRGLVLRTQHIEAQAVDTPSGVPALEARAANPGLGSAVAFVRRKGSADFLRLGLEARGAGRFSGTLPSLLAERRRMGTSSITSRGTTPAARSRAARATLRRHCISGAPAP